MKNKFYLFLFILLGSGAFSPPASAEKSISDSLAIEAEILQIKFGRLYLAVGLEALVLPGCQLSLSCGTDSVIEVIGVIEQAFEGVAISNRLSVLEGRTSPGKCIVRIIPARIDINSTILIGTDIPRKSPLPLLLKTCDSANNRAVTFYDSRTAMLIDYSSGKLDGYISYRSKHGGTNDNNVTSIPAPFMAILSPNPSREFNQYGKLTTSLYYHFDETNISSHFYGDNPIARNSVLLYDEGRPRAYPYDTDKGSKLFRSFRRRIKKLKIFVQDKSLRPMADYYADLLSRERCRVSVTNKKNKSDISLDWHLSSVSLAKILSADTTKEKRLNESIRLLDNLVQSAENESDSTRQQYMFARAERVLIHDIGLFPLFSPTIYLTTSRAISGNIFDDDGQMNICRLGRIVINNDETTR